MEQLLAKMNPKQINVDRINYKYNAFHGRIQRGGGTGGPPPLKNHKNIGFLCNTGPDPLTNLIATKSAFNVGPASARQRNAISMAFRWRADGGPFTAVFISSIPHQLKKKKNKKQPLSNLDPLWRIFLDPRLHFIL